MFQFLFLYLLLQEETFSGGLGLINTADQDQFKYNLTEDQTPLIHLKW